MSSVVKMKSFYSVFALSSVIFLCQLSNQFETSQIEWPNRMEEKKPSDLTKPSTAPDNADTLVTGSFDTNEFLSKWFDLKRFVSKHSNWVKLKDLKVTLSLDHLSHPHVILLLLKLSSFSLHVQQIRSFN